LEKGSPPKLLIFQIGEEESSLAYANSLLKSAQSLGFYCEYFHDKTDLSPKYFVEKLKESALNPQITGILLLRPVPPPHIELDLTLLIPPEKDIDCANPLSFGFLALGQPKMLPPTPAAIIEILKSAGIETSGRHIAIIGRSNVVGKPLALLLARKGEGDATVTLCHSRSKNLKEMLKSAEIVISACGCPNLINADMISQGTIVIDAGINYVEGKMVGDVNFASASQVASMITPVPGGVGPVTQVMLFRNLIKAYYLQK
jgi:methylenetetrahydrofolate dehydrogenase (NADP+)/methenyltetrahydrofolate cyclohydrolase